MKKRIVICLDGTWNNPATEKEYSEDDKVFKPTNVVKICQSIPTVANDGIAQVAYYDIGVGGLRKYPGGWNRRYCQVNWLESIIQLWIPINATDSLSRSSATQFGYIIGSVSAFVM